MYSRVLSSVLMLFSLRIDRSVGEQPADTDRS
jgi:hypothetical protein